MAKKIIIKKGLKKDPARRELKRQGFKKKDLKKELKKKEIKKKEIKNKELKNKELKNKELKNKEPKNKDLRGGANEKSRKRGPAVKEAAKEELKIRGTGSRGSAPGRNTGTVSGKNGALEKEKAQTQKAGGIFRKKLSGNEKTGRGVI